ncbi:glucosaminidase domain-containing protein [Alteromonas lipolytica]|uniref:Mannosyl-glycoprotein endo-beta-N-acetylglucosamidase n=1 Tax=Alteromonas lipolytica TaxID=1856405 RepID=A0A1E8FH30_9ALTE|nr:glucosaminidase domain-containing protein [Alteromonas lipolytica]OFI35231.1 mannosyl-glycoprotein endo-beta-N-acetylglucosamidase [Alteromonas lipolytica]GGF57787.1 glycoside hydrolase family 73 [Alteromonas lipolytica]
MHKRETSKIILIAVAVMAITVVLAWMTGTREPDILDVPETEQAEQPVPDFAAVEDTKARKQAFFAYLKPEVEKQNDYLLSLRHYLQTLQRQLTAGNTLTEDDNERLEWLAEEYRVDQNMPADKQIKQMLNKVDILPVELVLMQAANESAWGTSRFAQQGYNFFGLWCYQKGCGFVPSRRSSGASHEVARFDNLSRATYTYMRNINRHDAYRELRHIRASLRRAQLPVTGLALAEGLMNYSERGAAYVNELQNMIRYNKRFITE